jgi:hydroxymethylpyrimidine/phosphomethylpyrimidine kinase
MSSSPPLVLACAASDPTAGAGMQADILTIAALGCHPLSVLTAFTVQDTRGVEALQPVEAHWVEAQARRLFDELPVAAVKLGVAGTAANVRVLADILAGRGLPVVVDPVLASGRGDPLASDEIVAALKRAMLPLATVATPNSIEAEKLGGVRALLDAGCRYVLVTGTHLEAPEVVNTLHDARGVVREDRWPRLPGSYHGSGCTLASAIAALLALGREVPAAVREAQEFTWRSLAAGFRPGQGQFLPQRFFSR